MLVEFGELAHETTEWTESLLDLRLTYEIEKHGTRSGGVNSVKVLQETAWNIRNKFPTPRKKESPQSKNRIRKMLGFIGIGHKH